MDVWSKKLSNQAAVLKFLHEGLHFDRGLICTGASRQCLVFPLTEITIRGKCIQRKANDPSRPPLFSHHSGFCLRISLASLALVARKEGVKWVIMQIGSDTLGKQCTPLFYTSRHIYIHTHTQSISHVWPSECCYGGMTPSWLASSLWTWKEKTTKEPTITVIVSGHSTTALSEGSAAFRKCGMKRKACYHPLYSSCLTKNSSALSLSPSPHLSLCAAHSKLWLFFCFILLKRWLCADRLRLMDFSGM